jgi:hypothetical protein
LLFGVSTVSGVDRAGTKNPNQSKAKADYWKPWHGYKAAHPNATVDEWRKQQKKAEKGR